MSADIDIATRGEVVGDGTTLASRTRRRWLNGRGLLALAAALVLLVVLVTVLTAGAAPRGRLDGDSPRPDGARALFAVLARHGVEVHKTASLDDAVRRASEPGTTLVVFDRDGVLAEGALERLGGTAPSGIVLVDPGLRELKALAPLIAPAGRSAVIDPAEPRSFTDTTPDPLPARCDNPAALAAGEITAGGGSFQAAEDGAEVSVCFPGPSDTTRSAGSYATYTDNGRRVDVIGNWSVLSNGAIAENGNAALALAALGANASLVYYVPTIADQPTAGTTPPTLLELLPRWVLPVGAWAVLVSLVVFLWRGRRFGSLVVEPMPVLVRAAETVEGRARLYRRSGSRGRAALILRSASMTRIAARLKLPSSSRPPDIVEAVAERTGRPRDRVAAVLFADRVDDDGALTRLARDLHTLEKEVQQP